MKKNKAKELLENNPTIDISTNDDYPFKIACCKGHLNIAQWLLTVKPVNISNCPYCHQYVISLSKCNYSFIIMSAKN